MPPLSDGVTTLAGNTARGTTDGPRGVGLFNNPVNVEVGQNGRLYVADFDNSLIRVVDSDGNLSTIAPNDEAFWRPFGISQGADGTIWVQTDGDITGEKRGALWRVSPSGGAVLELDGIGRTRGLVALPDGRVALSDFLGHTISIYDPSTGAQTVIAGSDAAFGYNDGVGASVRFNRPYGLDVLPDGDILVTDQRNNRLRRVTVDGVVTTFAGTGRAGGADGELATAEFDAPIDLTVADDGTIYVSDAGGYRLRRIRDGHVQTIAGMGEPGWLDSEDPMQAQFYGMEGIATDGTYLYVADGDRGRGESFHFLRRVTLD